MSDNGIMQSVLAIGLVLLAAVTLSFSNSGLARRGRSTSARRTMCWTSLTIKERFGVRPELATRHTAVVEVMWYKDACLPGIFSGY